MHYRLLLDYQVEVDHPSRSVPNPAWKELDKELKATRLSLAKLEKEFGIVAIDNSESKRQTMRGFKIAHGKLGNQIRAARTRVAELEATHAALQRRVPVAEALQGQHVIKLSTERKHLTNILKMVVYQIESDLLNQLRSHYARAENGGRTLIQTALQSAASTEPTDEELNITLSPRKLTAPIEGYSPSLRCTQQDPHVFSRNEAQDKLHGCWVSSLTGKSGQFSGRVCQNLWIPGVCYRKDIYERMKRRIQ